jgi:hypothetical protein
VVARYSGDGPDYASRPLSLLTAEHRDWMTKNPYPAGNALLAAFMSVQPTEV